MKPLPYKNIDEIKFVFYYLGFLTSLRTFDQYLPSPDDLRKNHQVNHPRYKEAMGFILDYKTTSVLQEEQRKLTEDKTVKKSAINKCRAINRYYFCFSNTPGFYLEGSERENLLSHSRLAKNNASFISG